MVLEFIRLDSRHTGKYLALKLHECLEKYGLSKKMVLSFFTKQATCKKRTVKVAVSATQVEEVVLDGTPPDQEDADLAHLLDKDAAEHESLRNQLPDGTARNEHDTAVVCSLAWKLHDSAPVTFSFAKLVDADKTIVSQTLARRCASRWNSDYDSLDTTLILEQPVRKLLKEKDLNLKAFKLTDAQWNLAADLHDILEVFFIPSYSGGLVLDKYIDLVPNCEAYKFSIAQTPTPAPQVAPWGHVRHRFGDATDLEPPAPSQIPNDINSYLNTPPLASLNGKTVLQYWAAERAAQLDLAEMALTFCSAPATTVDGERSFLEGRNQCGWNQESMSPDIPRADERWVLVRSTLLQHGHG
ncbi:hypothetical protein DFH07DRAFT_946374 [Mycena maculata]|uniref:HAT C-terminal dimerisation domain-containing protein n=1 Tax=Mycena maculata TaxID=230809 RepID=A0AAD7HPC0_9AGAR|nr:hypothetical protein DFH07DRAFT_946374 [Mycena maculata]